MNPQWFTSEDKNPPCLPFSKGGVKVPLWERGIEGEVKLFMVKASAGRDGGAAARAGDLSRFGGCQRQRRDRG